jgi:hypothetical protein
MMILLVSDAGEAKGLSGGEASSFSVLHPTKLTPHSYVLREGSWLVEGATRNPCRALTSLTNLRDVKAGVHGSTRFRLSLFVDYLHC